MVTYQHHSFASTKQMHNVLKQNRIHIMIMHAANSSRWTYICAHCIALWAVHKVVVGACSAGIGASAIIL